MAKTLLDHALEWAEQGVPVFPCGDSKQPLTSEGFYDASTDPVEVKRMFEFFGPSAKMIGGRMGKESGMFAVDVDLYKDGAEAWYKAAVDDGALPESRVHETMNGGLHILYEGDDYFPNCNPHKGVEIKGEGGYIILPGSPGYKTKQTGMVKANPALLEMLRYAERDRATSTTSDLEGNVLSGADFHASLTGLASKYAFQGWDMLRIQKRMREVLEASVAAAAGHDRHSRWRAIYEDRNGELTRIVKSAFHKFNDDGMQEDLAEFEGYDDLLKDAEGIFRQTEDKHEPGVQEGNPDLWPFAGQGYFADQEHDLTDMNFSMYPIYAENETVLMYAEPKTGKTAIALTTALHIACGFDLGHFKVEAAGPTLYYGLEGTRAIKLRVSAWRKKMEEDGVKLPKRIPMFVVEKATNFLKADQRTTAAQQIIDADAYCKARGEPLKAIYIDTLTKAMAGGNQNDVEDTSHLFEIVSLVRSAGVTATIVFVHHKSKTGQVRGSSNLEAEPDVLLDISKKGEVVTMKIARARSIEDGLRFHFRIEGVDLGQTKQGHPLVGIVALPTDDVAPEEDTMADHLFGEDVGGVRRALAREYGPGQYPVKDVLMMLNAIGSLPANVSPAPSRADTQQFLHQVASEAGVTYDNTHISLVKSKGKVTHFLVRRLTS